MENNSEGAVFPTLLCEVFLLEALNEIKISLYNEPLEIIALDKDFVGLLPFNLSVTRLNEEIALLREN